MKSNEVSTILTAAAIQDHISRSIFSNNLKNISNIPLQKKGFDKKKKVVKDDNFDKEYILEKNSTPTLAERLGIVEKDILVVTELDWATIKLKAIERNDFKQPCVICKEPLGNSLHVILSCSHVFHKNCIQAFEKFIGSKSCPLCRQNIYKTRIVHDARLYFKHQCATIIQSLWRGYAVRKLNIEKKILPFNQTMRRKYFHEKLSKVADKFVNSMSYEVEEFLNNLNAEFLDRENNKGSTILLETISWDNVRQKALKRKYDNCPICLTSLISEKVTLVLPKSCINSHKNIELKKNNTLKYTKNNMDNFSKSIEISDNLNDVSCNLENTKIKECYILSCSHIIHRICLENLEKFAACWRSNVCPVCRSPYIKTIL